MKDSKSYRIRTKIGSEADNVISVQLEQTFDSFEILSLKLDQKNAYKLYESDYGVIVGRVLANGGFGVPNAKVSIFIESEEDEDFTKRLLYPYKSTMNTNEDGVRYNLLPDFVDDVCHQNVGTFPNKRLVLDNNDIIEIFDKYYVYTTVTNNAGDYMIFGVPTGGHTLHVDLDLSDIGMLSQRPRDMIYKGYDINNFESPNKFKKSTNLDTLAQIYTQDKGVYVYPFWGDTTENDDNIAITRCDIELGYKFEPTCVFMGSIVTDTSSNSISKNCAGATGSGKMSELVSGEGTIEMIRKTIDNKVESFQIRGNRLIDGDGVWCYQIPMNLDYIMTDEYGNIVPSDNPEKGIPTRTRVRFRISLDKVPNDNTARNRCQYLVPNNPRLDEERYPNFTKTKEVDYEFGTATKDENYRDLLWNKVYTVKNYIPRLQKNTWVKNRKHTGIKLINHFGDNNPMPYNNLTIKLTFTYRLICVIAKAFINLIVFLNQILTLLSYPFCMIYKVFNGICKAIRKVPIVGKAISKPFCLLADWTKKAIPSCIAISSDFCGDNVTHNNTFYPGCGNILLTGAHMSGECIREKTEDHHNSKEKKDGTPEEERTTVSFATGELYNCIESALAEDHDVVSFNFHNDWINGVLYAPLWFRKITPKKRLLFGLIKRKAKDQWCSSEMLQNKKLKIFTPCAVRRDKEQTYKNFEKKTNKAYYMDKTMTCGKNAEKQQCLNERAYIGLSNGIIVKRETMLGEDVYYYQAAEYDHDERVGTNAIEATPVKEKDMNGAVKLLFATDIVLLGSLNDCDLQGVPQFFKSLEDTTYKMPPTLLFTDNVMVVSIDDDGNPQNNFSDDGENITVTQESKTEMTGADWGNMNEDICEANKGEKTQDSGLFYSIGCNSQRTLPKSCINLSRICEFGVSLDEAKDVLVGEPTENGSYNDFYDYLVPDGFISKDELFNIDERSAFASLNINGLQTKLSDETGLREYVFDYLYEENFDNSLRSHMEERQKKCNNTYRYNYILEEFSEGYYDFRMGRKPYFYDDEKYNKELEKNRQPTGRRLPRFENSFYFYFGLKHGKTALDKFNSQFFSICYDDEEIVNPIGIEAVGNDWCSDLMADERDGYVAFDFGTVDLPCEVTISGVGVEMTFTVSEDKVYISGGNRNIPELEERGYVLISLKNNFLPNGTYDVIVTDKNGEIIVTSFTLQSEYLQSNVVGTNFEYPDNVLLKMFNGSREGIKTDATGIPNTLTINATRDIGGTIAVSAPFIYNKTEDTNEDIEFYSITIQGIEKPDNSGYEYNVKVVKEYTFNDYDDPALLKKDNKPTIMLFGVPKPNECYTVTVAQECLVVTYQLKQAYGGPTSSTDGIISPKEWGSKDAVTKSKYERVEEFVESGNKVSYTVCIKEKQPFKLYINDVDYDLISDWDCGFKNTAQTDVAITDQNTTKPSDNWLHMSDETRYRWYNYIPYQKLDEEMVKVTDQLFNLLPLPPYNTDPMTFASNFSDSRFKQTFTERYGSGTANSEAHILYHISTNNNVEDEKDVTKRSEFYQIDTVKFREEITAYIQGHIDVSYTYVSEDYVSKVDPLITKTQDEYNLLPDSDRYIHTMYEDITETNYNKLTEKQKRDGTYELYLYRHRTNGTMITQTQYEALPSNEQSQYEYFDVKNDYYTNTIQTIIYRGLDNDCKAQFSFWFANYKSTVHVKKDDCSVTISDADYDDLTEEEQELYYDLTISLSVYKTLSNECRNKFKPVYYSSFYRKKTSCKVGLKSDEYNALSPQEKNEYYPREITETIFNSLSTDCQSFYADSCYSDDSNVKIGDCSTTIPTSVYNSLPKERVYFHTYQREISQDAYDNLSPEEKENCVKIEQLIKSDFYDLVIDYETYSQLDNDRQSYFTEEEVESDDALKGLLDDLKDLTTQVEQLKDEVIDEVKKTFQLSCTEDPKSILYRAVTDDRPVVYHEIHKGEQTDELEGFNTVECEHKYSNSQSIDMITIPTITTKDSKFFGDEDNNDAFVMQKFKFEITGSPLRGDTRYDGTVTYDDIMYAVDNRSECSDDKKKKAYFVAVQNSKYNKKGSTIPDRFINGDNTYGYYFGYHIIDKIFDFNTLGWTITDNVPYFIKLSKRYVKDGNVISEAEYNALDQSEQSGYSQYNGNPHGNTVVERDIFESGPIVMNGLFTGIMRNGNASKYVDYVDSGDSEQPKFEEQLIGNIFEGEFYTHRADGETDADVEDRMPTKRYLTGSGNSAIDDTDGFEKNYLEYAIEDCQEVQSDMWRKTHKQYCQLTKFDDMYTFKDKNDCTLSDDLDAKMKIVLSSNSVNNCREKDQSIFNLTVQNCSDEEELLYYVFDAKDGSDILYPLNKVTLNNEDKYEINIGCDGVYTNDNSRIFDASHLEYLFTIYTKSTLKPHMASFPNFGIAAKLGNVQTTSEVESKYENERTEQTYPTFGCGGTGEFKIRNKNFHKPLYAVAITKNNMRTISPVYDYRYVCVTLLFGTVFMKQEKIDEDGVMDGYEVLSMPKMTFDVANIAPSNDIDKILYYFYNYQYDVKFECKLDDVNTVSGSYTHTSYKDNPNGYVLFDLDEAAYNSLLNIYNHSNGKVGKTIKKNTTIELVDVTGLKHIPEWCPSKDGHDCHEGCVAYVMKKWVTIVWVVNGGYWEKSENCDTYIDAECECETGCDYYGSEADYTRIFEAGETYKPYDVGLLVKDDCGQGSELCPTEGEGFLGWSRTPDGTDIVDPSTEITLQGKPEEAMIYYAVWSCDIKGVSWIGCEDPVTHERPTLKSICVAVGTVIGPEDMPISDDPDIVYEWEVIGSSYDESLGGYVINAETRFNAICKKTYSLKFRFTNYIDTRNSHIDLVHLRLMINDEEKTLNNIPLGITSPQYGNNSIVVEHYALKNLMEGDLVSVTEIMGADTNDGCNIFDTSACLPDSGTCCPRRDYGHGQSPYDYDPRYEVTPDGAAVGSTQLQSGIIDIVFIDRAYVDCTKRYDVQFVSQNTGNAGGPCEEYVYQTIQNVCKNEIVQEYRNPDYMKYVNYDAVSGCTFEVDNSLYAFTGWNPNPATTPINPPSGVTVFKFVAQWEVPRVIFSFFVNNTQVKLDRQVSKGYTINAVDIPTSNEVSPHIPEGMTFTGNWIPKINFNGSWVTTDVVLENDMVGYAVLQDTRFYAEIISSDVYIVQFKVSNHVVQRDEIDKNSQNPYVTVPDEEDFEQYIPNDMEFTDSWEDQDGNIYSSNDIEALAINQDYYFTAILSQVQTEYPVNFTLHGNNIIPTQNVVSGQTVSTVPTVSDVENSQYFESGDTFEGYWREPGTTNSVTRDYILALPITKATTFEAVLGTENLTVRFLWNYEQGMTVDKDGNVLPSDITDNNVPYGSQVTTPTNPVVLGYDFLGWYVNGIAQPYPVNTNVEIRQNTDFNGDWAVQQFVTYNLKWHIQNYSRLTIIGITVWLKAIFPADSSQNIECQANIQTGGSFHNGEYRHGNTASIQGLPNPHDSNNNYYVQPIKASINYEFNGNTFTNVIITRATTSDVAYIGNGPSTCPDYPSYNLYQTLNSSSIGDPNCTDVLSIGIYDGQGAPTGPFTVSFYVNAGGTDILVVDPPKSDYTYNQVLHQSDNTIPSENDFLTKTGNVNKYELRGWAYSRNPEGRYAQDYSSYTRLTAVKTFTATFNWNDVPNFTTATRTVEYGTTVPSADIPKITDADAPSYPNHTFEGWTPNPLATTIIENTIFNGTWSENAPSTVTVAFIAEEQNSSPVASWTISTLTNVAIGHTLTQNEVPDEQAILGATPNSNAYLFVSWEGGQSPAGTTITPNTTSFKAYVQKKTFTVTFKIKDDDSGSVIGNDISSMTVPYGYLLSSSDLPSNNEILTATGNPDAYDLSNLYWKVGNGYVDFYNGATSEITTNRSVYAMVMRKYFTVKYIHNDGTGNETNVTPLPFYGDAIVIITPPQYADHTFNGWRSNLNNQLYQAGASYTVEDNVVFTGDWTSTAPNTHTVTFVYNNGTNNVQTETVNHNASVTMPSQPTYDANHSFNGWVCSLNGQSYAVGATYSNVVSDITFTASWKVKVEFTANGGTIVGNAVQWLAMGSENPVVPSVTPNAGKVFHNEWVRSGHTTHYGSSEIAGWTFNEPYTFEAVLIDEYTVEFYIHNGSTDTMIGTIQTVESGQMATPPNDTAINNAISGTGMERFYQENAPDNIWRISNANGTFNTYATEYANSWFSNNGITSNMKFFLRTGYRVYFDFDQPTLINPNSQLIEQGHHATAPTPGAVANCTFTGWDSTVIGLTPSDSITSQVTFTALWDCQEPPTPTGYTVTWVKCGTDVSDLDNIPSSQKIQTITVQDGDKVGVDFQHPNGTAASTFNSGSGVGCLFGGDWVAHPLSLSGVHANTVYEPICSCSGNTYTIKFGVYNHMDDAAQTPQFNQFSVDELNYTLFKGETGDTYSTSINQAITLGNKRTVEINNINAYSSINLNYITIRYNTGGSTTTLNFNTGAPDENGYVANIQLYRNDNLYSTGSNITSTNFAQSENGIYMMVVITYEPNNMLNVNNPNNGGGEEETE